MLMFICSKSYSKGIIYFMLYLLVSSVITILGFINLSLSSSIQSFLLLNWEKEV